jgi:ABC-type sugar transport system ATPase subunit
MNLVPVQAHSDNGRPALRNEEFKVEVPERLLASVRGGSEGLVAGFRPEHLRVGDAGAGDARIPATVDVVEYLGDEQLVHLHAGEVNIVARLDGGERAQVGEDVALTLPIDKLYLFDGETKEALASSAV